MPKKMTKKAKRYLRLVNSSSPQVGNVDVILLQEEKTA